MSTDEKSDQGTFARGNLDFLEAGYNPLEDFNDEDVKSEEDEEVEPVNDDEVKSEEDEEVEPVNDDEVKSEEDEEVEPVNDQEEKTVDDEDMKPVESATVPQANNPHLSKEDVLQSIQEYTNANAEHQLFGVLDNELEKASDLLKKATGSDEIDKVRFSSMLKGVFEQCNVVANLSSAMDARHQIKIGIVLNQCKKLFDADKGDFKAFIKDDLKMSPSVAHRYQKIAEPSEALEHACYGVDRLYIIAMAMKQMDNAGGKIAPFLEEYRISYDPFEDKHESIKKFKEKVRIAILTKKAEEGSWPVSSNCIEQSAKSCKSAADIKKISKEMDRVSVTFKDDDKIESHLESLAKGDDDPEGKLKKQVKTFSTKPNGIIQLAKKFKGNADASGQLENDKIQAAIDELEALKKDEKPFVFQP